MSAGAAGAVERKLVLVMVDSLRADMLGRAIDAGRAPTLARLLDRGTLIERCVSSYPSVTPVACAEIVTGVRADEHGICGMNWYLRPEHRYVEYGSSFEATRAFGLFRALYDTVYNMNLSHLSPHALTLFERLGDAGVRTACTPFLIFRGRRRHELGLEGLLRRAATAARFHHAVWGPDELFYGELYSSRRTPCRPTYARPGTRDAYSACVARELIENDLYDFMLFSLPDNDHHTHNDGPDAMPEALAGTDQALGELVSAAGGLDAFLAEHAVIVMGDHGQTEVERELGLIEELAAEWSVLRPTNDERSEAQLAVAPTGRAAGIYVLDDRYAETHEAVREHLAQLEGVDLVGWLCGGGDQPIPSHHPHSSHAEAVVRRGDAELRFSPGGPFTDERGRDWAIDGDLDVLRARTDNERARFESATYPDALARLWGLLSSPNAPDITISLAVGWECTDWGEVSHVPGGSHGSLGAGDSEAALLLVGLENVPERPAWALADVAPLVLSHFGIGADD